MAAGHFSHPGIFDHVRDEAFHFAFIIWALSSCPDGLGGETRATVVFRLVFALIGAGIILAVAGWPRTLSWSLLPQIMSQSHCSVIPEGS